MATKNKKCRRWSEEKISSAVLIVLVAMTLVMFALFFSVGYDEEWEENTDFISPAYTDSLISFMFFMAAGACIVTVASAVWFSRCHGHAIDVNGRIPSRKIAAAVIILLAAVLSLTFFTASDSPILINGKSYTDTTWLCITDMLIKTSEILLVVAVLAVIYGMSGINRRIQKH